MKKSIFGGHIIDLNDSVLKNINSNELFESYSADNKRTVQSKLSAVGISEYEQFYAISNTSSRDNLKAYLAINESEYQKFVDASAEIIRKEGIKRLDYVVYGKGLGALLPEQQLLTESLEIDRVKQITGGIDNPDLLYKLAAAHSLVESNLEKVNQNSEMVCPLHNLIPIRNQGNRGTCVAFAISANNEYYQKKRSNQRERLSEQHLYYEAKQLDGNIDCGTTLSSAIKAVSLQGQCRERFWRYNLHTDCNDHGEKPVMASIDSEAHKATCLQLNSRDIEIIKAAIISEGLVSITIPVFTSWMDSTEVNLTGRLTLPLPNETPIGGHAVTIVGYTDDVKVPGGGFFIFRNSWGISWAPKSIYAPGFGLIPYEYVKEYCVEAYTLI